MQLGAAVMGSSAEIATCGVLAEIWQKWGIYGWHEEYAFHYVPHTVLTKTKTLYHYLFMFKPRHRVKATFNYLAHLKQQKLAQNAVQIEKYQHKNNHHFSGAYLTW